MINILICCAVPEEIRCIRQLLSAYSIQNSWADLRIEISASQIPSRIDDHPLDIVIVDVSIPGVVTQLKAAKAAYPPTLVYPIAGPNIPPPVYVCPEIMPCGLFWRPLTTAAVQPVIGQMMSQIHERSVPASQNSFRITGKQKVQEIPFPKILYFEAREKKLILRLQEQELPFTGTLSQLEDSLPPEFLRCHKSFIVNRRHILSVDRTNSLVVLDNHAKLPLSRSYKKDLWEVFHGDT